MNLKEEYFVKNKFIAFIMILSLAVTAVGCGSSKGNDVSGENSDAKTVENTAKQDKQTPTEEDIYAPFSKYKETVVFSQGKGGLRDKNLPEGHNLGDNDYYRYIEGRINVKVKNAWELNGDAYTQKVSMSVASGDIPDVMIVNKQTLSQLVESDLIQDLTEVYNKTASPHIKECYDSFKGRILPAATYDGKLMALPATYIGGEHNQLWIRKDWLDKLGLAEPKTIDDIIKIAKAFIEKDPDGNGKADTIGLTGSADIAGYYSTLHTFDTVFSLFNAYPRQWMKDASGNVFYGSTAPEMKPALAKLNEMYKAGIIDKQFAVRKSEDTNALLVNNNCGIFFGAWWIPYWPLMDAVKSNPKADWKPYNAPLDENGMMKIWTQKPANNYLVVRKGYEHPEAVMKVLNVQQDGMRGFDPKGVEIYKGLGVGWTMWPFSLQIDYEDAVYRMYKNVKKALDEKNPEPLRFDYKNVYENCMKELANPKADASAWAEYCARIDGQALTFAGNVERVACAFYDTTPTMETKWTTLKKLEDETLLKIVLGDKSVDEFDKFVEQWKKLGGDEITKEITDALKK